MALGDIDLSIIVQLGTLTMLLQTVIAVDGRCLRRG